VAAFATLPDGATPIQGVSPSEPVSGDSLTQYIRALVNQLTGAGGTLVNQGQGLVQGAAGGVNTAAQTMQPSVDYWTALLSGDPAKMSAAVAPTANAMSAQYTGAAKSAGANLPRGGYASVTQANLPFKQAQDIGQLFQTLQPTAATQLQSLGQTQGGLASILGNLGLGQEGVGTNLFNLAGNMQLQRRGQNVSESGQNKSMTTQLASTWANLLKP
jgi:hypothetical protein